jgi:ATP-dependent exoDNAse (exonuclease V) alpha subunit
VLPATIQGIRRYLGSGLVKGIGLVFAERIVEHFGLDTLQIIEDEPGRLVQVPGLGPKRTAKITAAWAEQKAIKEVMVFLQGVGVSTSIAVRIYKKYGDASISVVKNEPYRLAADVWGIGFDCWRQRDQHGLVALAANLEDAVTVFLAEIVDVRAAGFEAAGRAGPASRSARSR